jgi:hypothetical protein
MVMNLLISRPVLSFVRLVVALIVVGTLAGARTAWSHPIHTTLTEIAMDADGTMHFTIRAFADDFSAAVAKHAGKPRPADYVVPEADIVSYVTSAVSVEDASGKRAPVAWSGSRRAGDVVWVTFKVPSVRALRGVKIASTLLFELYDDQVNIVQTTEGGRHRSMLFTTGDGKKLKSIE